ncbi:isopeptide-forming domain-containing fimbrial protein [Halalkalibacterium halodurans]|uniref:isopeptide-forming domain-containing fimbrial protein n=1 Tax=Halalkalibacterium halodurans TaxID=86665 RepID=UPI002AAA1B63|nr:isopeptide-forming domain-containing fimbrial protein [Halalkalibacterium halodurans]MDY7224169.1 isopeptide-forming domain-containing fimbrial protein [Halalkalibacterium halodurans]MDY7243454.1 isopeptide-forming domain-containing fimbrial protein [Halalkalibacterium halodurans]
MRRRTVVNSLKQYLTLFMVFLVISSGILPMYPAPLYAEGNQSEDEWVLSKEVEGQTSKEVGKEEKFSYDINLKVPDDLEEFENLTVIDEIDARLTIQQVIVVVDDEVDSSIPYDLEGQKVLVEFSGEELKNLAGKMVTVQVMVQLNDDVEAGEQIENVAEVMIGDGTPLTESNNVVVTVAEEEAKPADDEEHRSDSEPGQEGKEGEALLADTEATSEEEQVSEKEQGTEEDTEADNQVQATDGITINDTDQYAITNIDGKRHIVQYDGNNPSAGPIAMVELDRNLNLNALALGKNEDVLYASGGARLYKIYPDGTTELVTELERTPAAGVISLDGTKYVHEYISNGQLYIRYIDLVTLEQTSVAIDDQSGFLSMSGGDFIFDADGYLWFSRWSDDPIMSILAKIDVENREILSIIPLVSDTGENFSRAGGLSFLPNGKMLVYGSYDPSSGTDFSLFELDPGTGVATHLTADVGVSTDFASRVYPSIKPDLQIEKTNDPDGAVSPRDNITYTLKVSNAGNLASTLTTIQDELPEGTSYVPNTTTLNGEKVDDVDGTSPIFTGMSVQSPRESLAGVLYIGEENAAVVTFQVKVDDNLPSGTEIKNIATVNGDGIEDIPSNEVNNLIAEDTQIGSCPAPVALINGSFEEPPGQGSRGLFVYTPEEVPGWETTDTWIEIWDYAEGYPSDVNNGPPPVDGDRYAEINAEIDGMLYQDVQTTPGQTIYWRLSHKGLYGVDTMQVRIGQVTDNPYDTVVQTQMSSGNTAWETYTGTYTVPAGQTMTRFGFEAVSTSNGSPGHGNHIDDIFLGTGPCLVAEKSVSPEGEVFDGDVLTYEVTIKNEGGDVAADTIIEDVIPEGTEYVPGSMKIVNGPNTGDLTDEDDGDAGHFDGEKVSIQLGNLPNTNDLPDGVTVQFKVRALSSHVGETVTNKATVDYKNLLTGEDETTESNEVTNTIIERPVMDACARPVALINGSFEEPINNRPFPDPTAPKGIYSYFHEDEVPGWKTTASDQLIQIERYENGFTDISRAHGNQFAEINAAEVSTLYQDVETTPGQTIYWRLAHRGDSGIDTLQVRIGSSTIPIENLEVMERISSGNEEWTYYSGTYTVPIGQGITRFAFESYDTANGRNDAGNFLDDIFLGTEPCVVAEKSVSPEGEVTAGDELTYEVTIKNEGGDIAADVVFEDAIPEGTEYVPGSMRIVTGPNAGDLTDADDGDAGHFDGEKVIIQLGDLPNTTDLPDGITVQFKVTALSSHIGESIVNQASVGYKNLLTGEDETTESNEVTTPVEYKAPELEAEKTATLLEKADGNTDEDNPEVGDTLLYTIQARNTIEDSLVENLVISDVIPAGLEYVPGTLRVNGEAVTDAEDDDAGHYVDGEVVGQFGNVTDTEWRTLEFQVTVGEGQASQDIENVAVVGGDNVDEPERPSEEVKIYPRFPNLESEKTAVNADLFKDRFEVGDTVVYTIRARNTVSESLLENLVITDVLPEGLTYVEGSLDVNHDGEGSYEDGTITATFGDVTDTEWRTVRFRATIDSGYAGETIENIAVVEGDNVDEPSNPREEVNVEPKDPELEAEKTAALLEKADGNTDEANPEVGDTLLYTIQARNTIEDSLVENLVISDVIPEGLEYVPGTLRVNGEAVTDAEDDDAGHYVDGEVVGQFGNVTDTEWRTLEFQVTVGEGQASQDIENIAVVGGDNVDEPERPSEEVKIYPRFPNLESEKTATNLEDSKTQYEAGDTVVYTIRARNTVSESLLENLVITDELPEGITYVEGSLDVSHDGEGSYEDGIITANFGDVTDTEWRMVTFHATIDSGYVGETIMNVATVEGDNVDEPSTPEESITVSPKDPALESEKTATNLDDSKSRFEAGDTIVYTIRARNTIEDSLIEDMSITDELPEGLTYVEGSLDVSHDGEGSYEAGTITVNFGDVMDTEWRTVTFHATIDSGYVGETIENVAVVDGGNVDEPSTPEEGITVSPKDPALESEKTATNLDDSKNRFEAGDTIVYTIRARNTIEDSLIEDMSITDELPEGLTYVEGSLDVSHDGEGSYEGGTITVNFGDVMDTEWRTVTFHATIDSGYVGETIENVATVEGDNVDEPSTPQEEITVSPKDPVLESEKTAVNVDLLKDRFEAGDTVVYTIRARNTVSDSLIENLVITDELPEGLTYVEGSLDVSHDGQGSYQAGTITATFGDVTDTEWRTVRFRATIDSGYAGETIENMAVVDGDNIDESSNPREEVTVEPKEPVLEAEKTATLLEKADGNTDEDNPEVGDTLLYTIQARNTIEDSLIENLVISDVIPAGLEYVPGTLRVNGEAVTDAEDDDAGHYVNGEVVGQFGNVTDTEWRTLEFQVTVGEGQASQDIENVAVVDGDNVDEPERPSEEVKIYPRFPNLESEKTATNVDEAKDRFEAGDTIVYTIRARNTVSESLLENLVITDELPEGLTYVEGSLDVSHDGEGSYEAGIITANFGDVTDTEWRTVTFHATIDSGYVGETIENVATVEGENVDEPSTPQEKITISPKAPALESEKTATNVDDSKDRFEAGDTIVYTIRARNTVSDSLIENLVITDVLPEGITYVEGSLNVSHDGAGSYEGGTITATFGDVTDTEWRTLTFHATIDSGYVGETIENVATVEGENVDEPHTPQEEITISPKAPVLEAEKTATNLDEGKETYDVGDTIVYTIRARNTVSDSLIENLVITDELPEGITYVEGSLEVSHNGEGSYEAGIITANFGDVMDTEWRTVTFEATIDSGYAGETIQNVAIVNGDNVGTPGQPTENVTVNPEQRPEEPVDPVDPKDPIVKPQDPEKPVDSNNPPTSGGGDKLPKTATNTFLILAIGLGLLLVGLFLQYLNRKRKAA